MRDRWRRWQDWVARHLVVTVVISGVIFGFVFGGLRVLFAGTSWSDGLALFIVAALVYTVVFYYFLKGRRDLRP